MNAIRVNKKIEFDIIKIEELNNYKGRNAEIVVIFEDEIDAKKTENYNKVMDLVKRNQGTIKKYTREELYDR